MRQLQTEPRAVIYKTKSKNNLCMLQWPAAADQKTKLSNKKHCSVKQRQQQTTKMPTKSEKAKMRAGDDDVQAGAKAPAYVSVPSYR